MARLRASFEAVIDLAPEARADWIARNIDDPAERVALARLLAADQTDRGFLDTPVGEHASKLTADIVLAETLVGQRIGAFRLARLLGTGGMAAVFLGVREGGDFRQEVAIKLLRRGLYSEVEQRLFLRERQVLASLNHPNIARLFDGGLTEAGVPYLVMEYVDGTLITRYAAARSLDLRARLDLFLTVCRAVEAAHRALIVHRDIKPSNILVATDGTVKLLDFGIAKLLEENVEGATIGVFTPDYAAPEQIAAKPVTTATDVYALGVLLHELLLGTRPTRAMRRPSAAVAADASDHASRAWNSQLRKRLRGDLDNILMKALAPEPEQRYASAGAFADDIERHLAGQPVAAHPPSAGYRARKFIARHKVGALTTAGFLLAILAALGLALWQAGVAREQARVAHEQAQRADAVQAFIVGVFETNSSYQDDPVKARATTAQQLLEIGAKKIDGAMSDAPDAKLRMLNVLAEMHTGLGLDEEAADLYRKAIEVAQAEHGEHSLDVFDAQIELAESLHSANSDEEAKSVLEQAQVTLDQNKDPDRYRRAQLLDKFSEYYATRDMQRGLDYARQSVTLYEQLPPSPNLAFALSHKARAERQSGLDTDAIASYRRAIEISRAVDGDTSPDLPRYYAELGELQYFHHDIAGGEQSSRKALQSAKATHGENHVDVVQCEMRLGRLLADTGRVQEALSLLESARRKVLALRGPDDGFHTPQVMFQYGSVLIQIGRLEDGLKDLDAAIANRRHNRPGTIPLAQFLETAASARIELGQFALAGENLDESSAIRTKAGQKAPSALFDFNIGARIRLALAQQQVALASELVGQLSASTPNADPLDRRTIVGNLLVAEVRSADGQQDAAIDIVRSVRKTIEGSLLAIYYQPLVSRADFIEGIADLRKGDARSAIVLLERALAERRQNFDPNSAQIAQAEIALAASYLHERDIAKARELIRAADTIEATHAELGPQYRSPLSRCKASAGSRSPAQQPNPCESALAHGA